MARRFRRVQAGFRVSGPFRSRVSRQYRLTSGAQDAARSRHSTRPLRGSQSRRQRRHGRGLQGARHSTEPHRRHQGPARGLFARRGPSPAFRARGACRRFIEPSEYLCAPRRRYRIVELGRLRARLHRDGIPRGRNARGSARSRSAPAARHHSLRRRHRDGASRRPPPAHRPSRPETRQHHDHALRREAARLRSRQAGRSDVRRIGRPFDPRPHQRDDGGCGDGDGSVHGAGTGRGTRRRLAQRHFRARGRPSRDGHRKTRVQRFQSGIDRIGDPDVRSTPDRVVTSSGSDRSRLSGARSGPSLAVRA